MKTTTATGAVEELPEDKAERALLAVTEIRRLLTKPKRPYTFASDKQPKKWTVELEMPSILAGEAGKIVSILKKYRFGPVQPKKTAPCICGSKKPFKACCRAR